LDHPNILKLLEIYENENSFYYVTDYCSGGTLFNYAKEMWKKDNFFDEELTA